MILCDVMMPELDGYGVLLELHKQQSTERTPFIFLTAKADQTSVRQGMDAGADDYLSKPCSGADLLTAVAARLEKRDAVEQSHQQILSLLLPFDLPPFTDLR